MYQWDLLTTETGCRLVISRPRYTLAALGVATATIVLVVGYSVFQSDLIPHSSHAILLACLLIPAVYTLLWFFRRPFHTVFFADVNLQQKTISFSEQRFREPYFRTVPLDTLAAIDTMVQDVSWAYDQPIIGIQFRFRDGTLLYPSGLNSEQAGKIRWIIASLHDLTRLSGEVISDKNRPSPLFFSLRSLRRRRS